MIIFSSTGKSSAARPVPDRAAKRTTGAAVAGLADVMAAGMVADKKKLTSSFLGRSHHGDAAVARFVATRVSCPLRGLLLVAFLQFLIVSSSLLGLRPSSLHFVLGVSHCLAVAFPSLSSWLSSWLSLLPSLPSWLSCGCARRGCFLFRRGRLGPMLLLVVPAVAFRPDLPASGFPRAQLHHLPQFRRVACRPADCSSRRALPSPPLSPLSPDRITFRTA